MSDGKGLGGKGRLTSEAIDSMQTWYGRVIRHVVKADDFSDTEKVKLMQDRILAIPHHRVSTDSSPQHQYCPPGENSWCGWQRDKAKNTAEYEHHDTLPTVVFKCILPVFQQLSKEELLSKCLHGGTQNRNESLHNVIWSITPKVTYQKHRTFKSCVHLAVLRWNVGAIVLADLLQEFSI